MAARGRTAPVTSRSAMARSTMLLLLAPVLSAAEEACQCQASWGDASGSCSETPVTRSGCPTLEELRQCDPNTKNRWCKTTSTKCSGQFSGESDTLHYCDVTDPRQRSVLQKIDANNEPAAKCMTAAVRKESTKIFDLSPLHIPADRSFDSNWKSYKRGKEGHHDREYLMNVCGGLASPPASVDVNAVAYERLDEQNVNLTDDARNPHVMGRLENTSLASIHEGDLRLLMPGGIGSTHEPEKCPHRQALVIFLCDQPKEGSNLGAPFFVDEFNTCEYVFVWNSCAACPLGHPWRENNCYEGATFATPASGGFFCQLEVMNPASALAITVAICGLLYLVIGTAYNRLIVGERGFQQLPNFNFWAACCAGICSAPSSIYRLVVGKPKLNSFSVHNGGLLDDSDEDDVDEDAEDAMYD